MRSEDIRVWKMTLIGIMGGLRPYGSFRRRWRCGALSCGVEPMWESSGSGQTRGNWRWLGSLVCWHLCFTTDTGPRSARLFQTPFPPTAGMELGVFLTLGRSGPLHLVHFPAGRCHGNKAANSRGKVLLPRPCPGQWLVPARLWELGWHCLSPLLSL